MNKIAHVQIVRSSHPEAEFYMIFTKSINGMAVGTTSTRFCRDRDHVRRMLNTFRRKAADHGWSEVRVTDNSKRS